MPNPLCYMGTWCWAYIARRQPLPNCAASVLGQVILGSNHPSLQVSPTGQGPGLKPSGSFPSDPRAPRPGCKVAEGLWSGPGGFRLTLLWSLALSGPSPLFDKRRLWALFHLRWEKAGLRDWTSMNSFP